jgi:hypothetical protein
MRTKGVPLFPVLHNGEACGLRGQRKSENIYIFVKPMMVYVSSRDGYDVHTNANISLSQAILGGIIRIQVFF